MSLADELSAAGLVDGSLVALVAAEDGVALAWAGGGIVVRRPVSAVVTALAPLSPRWVWWAARDVAYGLVGAGVRPRACWDLGAVHRLLYGSRREDAGAVWAAAHGLPEPAELTADPDLLEIDDGQLVDGSGQLGLAWRRGSWRADPELANEWARTALTVAALQQSTIAALPDPRRVSTGTPLRTATAHSESAAALIAVELEQIGLPIDRAAMSALLSDVIGDEPVDEADGAARRHVRDAMVLRHFPGVVVDLRNPQQVKDVLLRLGIDVRDTRSWRLEPYAATSEPVADLLRWRKSERIVTTYGWRWLRQNVGTDDRLRGSWGAADAAAGRMTAQSGLHNLPGELRSAVSAIDGHMFVRADLGQVEPRVLAVISGDDAFAAAAREDDLYSPVAAALGCDRPTAKIAVLAAMYGQTSGAAGVALRDMDRTYPGAMAFLRTAEAAGVAGVDVRTWGGRLIKLTGSDASVGYGRYARNAVVQGAAAELFKAWTATVRAGLADIDAEIVLCLHDELLLHVPDAHVAAAERLLRSALSSTASWWAAESGVRFVADVSSAKTWAQTH